MPSTVTDAIPADRFATLEQASLTTEELTLRPLVGSDAPLLEAAYADESIVYWHGQTMTPEEAHRSATANPDLWRRGERANWAVTADDAALARIGLNRINRYAGIAELAYWTLPAARGRSVVPRALGVLMPWLFDIVGLHRLELVHSTRNDASCRVAQKSGFALEGTMRSQLRHIDGWHDAHLHARLSTDPR